MSLFDVATEDPGMLFGTTPGFRLHKLEVYNWGTFDKTVWTFSPGGETALLTGDVGSGKSTLVDALTTLLVAPKKTTYNKAADSSAKERTVASYVRGYFGLKRSAEGSGQPDALRDANHYSVLLATFLDRGLSQHVTLAQVFWFQDAQRPPARFYVVADKEMRIAEDFSKFERDIKVLKKRLRNSDKVQVFEDYPKYAEVFRRKFGIVQEQALDLFQQTISMKKVEALTEFVRANMLEVPSTTEDVKKLIAHFHDLDCAHAAVCKAKKQIELIRPIVDQGRRCGQLQDKLDLLGRARQALGPWFAEQSILLLSAEISRLENELTLATAAREQAEVTLKQTEKSIKTIEIAIYANGGGALEKLKDDIEKIKENLKRIQEALVRYSVQAEILQLPLPTSLDTFINNHRKLPQSRSAEETLQYQLNENLLAVAAKRDEAKKELDQVGSELESLRSRKSSIPREYIEKRKQLCQSLNISEEELPFVGELLEVRNGEENWEGAIERLLHNFGVSLLVPEQYYSAVAQWVDRTSLGMRLVYYRIQQEIVRPILDQPHPLSVVEKLAIKPDSPLGPWLARELQQRFSYVCCEGMEEFRRERQAITKAGQIKANGKRHEKDDRYGLNDRRRFVLGFSNQKKIAVLEETERILTGEVKRFKDGIVAVQKKQKDSQDRLNAISELDRFIDFSEIDVNSKEQEIAVKEQHKKKLEQESNVLQALQEQLEKLEEQKQFQGVTLTEAQRHEISLESKLKNFREDKASAKEIADKATFSMREQEYPFLEKQKQTALGSNTFTLKNINMLERDYGDWIEHQRDVLINEIKKLREKIVRTMTEYKNEYPVETSEVDASLEALPEYERMLERLEKDGLPKFEKRFKELLHVNTINQIALFQSNLRREQLTIQKRIEQINASLNSIDYNDGRYIRLEYDETYDSDIKDFRVQLKACTEGALTGSEDEQYAEAKFLQVKAIIERFRGRPGETEADERWMKKVIDVRNWFLFAASERWRETNEEYEHYTDSGGKSGGQKEKLAYTILAASLVYHFGLEGQGARPQSFRFVVIDEAFLKSSDESARYGLELFKKLDLQLLIVTPLLKIPTIAQFIAHVGFVHHNDEQHQSMLRNISIEEYERERQAREVARYARVV